MELLTTDYHISGNTIWCYDFRLCNKLNAYLNEYVDYKFEKDEEGKFTFTPNQLSTIKAILKIKG